MRSRWKARPTTLGLPDIATALAVGAIIEGAILRTDTRVRITARLARRTHIDPEAYQAYLRGRFQWNLRSYANLQQAAELFKNAIARDPDFALAHAGLADTYVVLGDYGDVLPAEAYGRAREAADTALRLDPSLAEAHTVRAWLAMSLEHDWTAAEASFQRALQLNPGYATAHQWHGEFLAALGRFDEALAAIQRAQDLDPLAPMPQAIDGWMALLAGRYDEAIRLCEKVLARDPTFRPDGCTVPGPTWRPGGSTKPSAKPGPCWTARPAPPCRWPHWVASTPDVGIAPAPRRCWNSCVRCRTSRPSTLPNCMRSCATGRRR